MTPAQIQAEELKKRAAAQRALVAKPPVTMATVDSATAQKNPIAPVAPVVQAPLPVVPAVTPQPIAPVTPVSTANDLIKIVKGVVYENGVPKQGLNPQQEQQYISQYGIPQDMLDYSANRIGADKIITPDQTNIEAMTRLEQSVQNAKDQAKIKKDQEEATRRQQQEAISRTKSATETRFLTGREGLQANAGIGEGIAKGVTRQLDDITRQAESFRLAEQESQQQLDYYQRTGQTDLANKEAERLSAIQTKLAEKEKDRIKEDKEAKVADANIAKQVADNTYKATTQIMDFPPSMLSTVTGDFLTSYVKNQGGTMDPIMAEGYAAKLNKVGQLGLSKNADDQAQAALQRRQLMVNIHNSQKTEADKAVSFVNDIQSLVGKNNFTQADADSILEAKGYKAKTTDDKFIPITVNEEVWGYDPKTNTIKKLTNTTGSDFLLPSGELITGKSAGKDVTLDSAAMVALQAANLESKANGGGDIVISQSVRDQRQTILTMAAQFGVTISDPSSDAQIDQAAATLRAKGHQVASIEASNHPKGLAIDLTPNFQYIASVKPILERNGWKQSIVKGDSGHFDFVGTQTKQDAFSRFETENIAMSVIPVQLRNSDTEKKYYQEGIRAGLKQGKSPYEIADILMGFKIDKPDSFSSAIRDKFSMTQFTASDIANTARLINQGNKEASIRTLENSIISKYKKENPGEIKVSEASANLSATRGNAISNNLNRFIQAGNSPVGVVEGTMQQWLGRFKTQDAQTVASEVTKLVAPLRHELLGSATTESEITFLEPLIPKLSDNPENFMIKLNQLQNMPLQELNAIRSATGLPPLDQASLLDIKQRIGLYGDKEESPVDRMARVKQQSQQQSDLEEINNL